MMQVEVSGVHQINTVSISAPVLALRLLSEMLRAHGGQLPPIWDRRSGRGLRESLG